MAKKPKLGITRETKSRIMRIAIAKAREYRAQGLPWREALRKALKEAWAGARGPAYYAPY